MRQRFFSEGFSCIIFESKILADFFLFFDDISKELPIKIGLELGRVVEFRVDLVFHPSVLLLDK